MLGSWGPDIDEQLVDHVMAVAEQHSVGLGDSKLAALLYSVLNASPLMADPAAAAARATGGAAFEHLREQVCGRMVNHGGLWG